jgi:ornithine cyclodeaminase/alanine dehydrogenase-like protein (mu-crystallin family)
VLIVRHHEVRDVLNGRERQVVDVVRTAYRRHDEGRTVVPHSIFLRLPATADEPDQRNRIIGLPAHIAGDGDDVSTAGFKWIASFPGNVERGLDRASAVIVLNSLTTGRPEALIEGSLISAARTAASAALAADMFARPDSTGVSLVGCGVINLTVLRFLKAVRPDLARVTLFDLDPVRAAAFAGRCADVAPGVTVTVAGTADEALARHDLASIATTTSAARAPRCTWPSSGPETVGSSTRRSARCCAPAPRCPATPTARWCSRRSAWVS